MLSVRRAQKVLKARVIESAPDAFVHRYSSGRKSLYDYRRFLGDLGIIGATSVIPARFDQRCTDPLGRGIVKLARRRRRRTAHLMAQTLDPVDSPNPEEWMETAAEYMTMRTEVRWSRGRGAGWGRGCPSYSVSGQEHLHQAAARGDGVVLWRMMFTSATPVNAALADLGYPLVHLSSASHQTRTASRWSRKVVGPLLTRDEARFLRRRIIRTDGSGGLGYLRELRTELESGAVVSIVGTFTTGRSAIPNHLGNKPLDFPTGAPSLAHASGAALLPCAAIRTGPHQYEVIIGSELMPDRTLTKREFRSLAVERFARITEDWTRQYPASAFFWDRQN